MSTLSATNLKNASSGSNNIVLNTDGSIAGTCLTQTCRAWVNFNGTGVVAIRASYNVSSITDNGTGDYTVNFTAAMPDANYVVCGSTQTNGSSSNGTGNASVTLNRIPANALTINGARLYTRGSDDLSPSIDPLQVCVSIFR